MSNVLVKPLARIDTPDGPLCATEVDGAIVHGGKSMTVEGKERMREIIEAARKHLAAMRAATGG